MTIEVGQVCETQMTGLTHDGRGVGRTADGRAIFVPGVLPGERARVRITRCRPRYCEGVSEALLVTSPDRIQPFCPDFEQCGGCSMQHLAYAKQLVWKRQQVVDALTRIGRVADAGARTRPTIGMSDPLYSRHKVAMPVRPEGIGFFARGSRRVVPFSQCRAQHIAGPIVRQSVAAWMRREEIPAYADHDRGGLVRHLVVRASRSTGEVQVVLVLASAELDDGTGVPLFPGLAGLATEMATALADAGLRLAGLTLNAQPEPGARIIGEQMLGIHGVEAITERLDGLDFTLSPASFFQVNPPQAETLYEIVVAWASESTSTVAYDLYCGTGTIACLLARKFARVVGIESEPAAVQDAIVNAQHNGLAARVTFIAGQVEQELAALWEQGETQQAVVVLDPPRRGCEARLLDTLVRAAPPRIVYVSCAPSTLARDVARLVEGGYRVERVQPVDLFPWTEHVETVVLMSRNI